MPRRLSRLALWRITTGSCAERRTEHTLDIPGGHFAPVAGSHAVEAPGTDGDTDQTQCRQPDGCGHAPHLTVAPLVEHDFQPVGRYLCAIAHRRGARRDLRGRTQMAHADRVCCTIIEHDALAQARQRVFVDHALDLNPVGFRQFVTRMRHACLPGTVIGQQQQAFRVEIQAPSRI